MVSLVPKGCHVRYVALDGRGSAEVRVSCDQGIGTPERRYSRKVRATVLYFRGSYVSGTARVDFVLSPAAAVCSKSGSRITCKLVGDTSQVSLRGARRRSR